MHKSLVIAAALAALGTPLAFAETIPSNEHLQSGASVPGDNGTCVGANTATDVRNAGDPRAACDPANPQTQPSPDKARNRDTGRGERSAERDRPDRPMGLMGAGDGGGAGSAMSGTGFGPHAGGFTSSGTANR